MALQLPFATILQAQSSPDTRSPLIELEAVAESQAEESQVFTAQVVDDRLLKDVLLYHRRTGQQAFTPTPMTVLGDSAYYTASINTDPEDLRSIEYYVQARDESGNRTVEGYAFDPYTRVLIENEALVLTAQAKPETTPAFNTSSIRWWHIAAGILVAGAIASAAKGGGSDSSDDATAPLTFNLTGP